MSNIFVIIIDEYLSIIAVKFYGVKCVTLIYKNNDEGPMVRRCRTGYGGQ